MEYLASTGLLGFMVLFLFHIFWFLETFKRNDLVSNITNPFVIAFFVSGQSQYTFGDGENLIF